MRTGRTKIVSSFLELSGTTRGLTCTMSSNVVEMSTVAMTVSPLTASWHPASLELIHERKNIVMTKTIDALTEIIRNPKHPFRKADDRPVKAQKNRYERRKIKEFIKLGDWGQESPD